MSACVSSEGNILSAGYGNRIFVNVCFYGKVSVMSSIGACREWDAVEGGAVLERG